MTKHHLVTGAAGLIGFELTKQLLAVGDQVTAIDCYLKGGADDLAQLAQAHADQLTIIEGDLCDADTLRGVAGPIDTIYHLAAIVGVAHVNANPYDTLQINVRSTCNVMDLAMASSCRCVAFASSSENYAGGVDHGWIALPTDEAVPLVITDIQLPRWSYAASKIAGEAAVFGAAHKAGFIPVAMRFHNVYGPRMGLTHVIPELFDRCRRKLDPLPVYGLDATRSFLHVDDAARAIRLATSPAAASDGGIINIGSDQEISIQQLLETMFELTGHHPTLEAHPAPPGSVKRRVPDIHKLQALGFSQTIDLVTGLRSLQSA
ncbi:MAG: NAD-dependent epimerase/dehydratase family protein [Verrucomicrobia bacterium]|nr:NAD-dependent epimerase/dehydratase family protein [Verrucomicrobiota bacterium]